MRDVHLAMSLVFQAANIPKEKIKRLSNSDFARLTRACGDLSEEIEAYDKDFWKKVFQEIITQSEIMETKH